MTFYLKSKIFSLPDKKYFWQNLSCLFLCTLLTNTLYAIETESSVIQFKIGTNVNIDSSFHQILARKQHIGLLYPGYIVGIEKAFRSSIGMVDSYQLDSKIEIKDENPVSKLHLAGILNDPKRLFVSHIVRYEKNKQYKPRGSRLNLNIIYSVYQQLQINQIKPIQVYNNSWLELDKLEEVIGQDVKKEKYSHVFVFVMGWNADQNKAIYRINKIMASLLRHKKYIRGGRFKPLVVGVTWPSKWPIYGISFFNKANDADELGLTWLNYLVNKVLLSVKQKYNTKIVLLGHSFGARSISRALFSSHLIPSMKKKSSKVDLFVALQGAFSVNRFFKNRGNEGLAYIDVNKYIGKICLTWSKHDYALPIAKYFANVNFVGSRYGYRYARANNPKNLFEFAKADSFERNRKINSDKIMYINANSIIRKNKRKIIGSAHSEIFSQATGLMLAHLIVQYAQ